ncbi:diguanylate cyclase [Ferviditalea candida]|uniref:Diguanylate cyclase n=1 Tax=Ferviditalea candida TaxID=3108399 RepID=A0ABU5ZDL8_9BACL|nr:diguanylate cyclase [Paenibacillaceae bacterium T2]
MSYWFSAATNIGMLVALNYIGLKIRSRLIGKFSEQITIPLLTSAASILMMFYPIADNGFPPDLRFIPILMAGLRFGYAVAFSSALLPAAVSLFFDNGYSFWGIPLEFAVPAIASSIFHRTEYRTGFVSIHRKDGLMGLLLYFLILLVAGYFHSQLTSFEWIRMTLQLMIISALTITLLIAMYNEEVAAWIMQRKLELLANQDSLTGLPNYRSFLEVANSILRKRKISIMMIDVDHFKNYNDSVGHLKGDELLRKVAKLLRHSIGELDYLARYGGEEFILLCHTNEASKLAETARRLCSAISAYRFAHQEVQPLGCISVSIGIASARTLYDDLHSLIDAADEALYASKHAGRNRFSFNRSFREGNKDA